MSHFLFAIWVLSSVSDASELPPGGAISLDFVMQRALEASDSFQTLRAEALKVRSPALQSLSLYDPQVSVSGGLFDSDAEPTQAYLPVGQKGWQSSARLRTQIPTGTAVQLEMSHQRAEVDFATAPQSRYHSNEGKLTVSQSLWKDAFGFGGRASWRAGRDASAAMKEALFVAGEDWWLQFADLFYESWLAQRQAEAAASQLGRRQKLSEVLKLRVKRGTSLRSDALQVEAALLGAQSQFEDRRRSLSDIWRGLVVALNLPEHYMKIDPSQIPMKLDDSVSTAQSACASVSKDQLLEINREVRAAKENHKARREASKAAQWGSYGDLQAFGSLSATNVEPAMTSAMSDSMQGKHGAWTLGVKLDLPILRARERAEANDRKSDERKSSSLLALKQSEVAVKFLNDCEALKSLQANLNRMRLAFDRQSKRERELAARFERSDASVFELVQSGDDVTQVETNVNLLEAQARMKAWRILRLVGEVSRRLETFLHD